MKGWADMSDNVHAKTRLSRGDLIERCSSVILDPLFSHTKMGGLSHVLDSAFAQGIQAMSKQFSMASVKKIRFEDNGARSIGWGP